MVEVPSFDLFPDQLAYIGEVGAALFEGRTLQASRNGLISVTPIVEAPDVKGLNNEQWQGTRGPATGSRQRRQGPPSEAHSSGAVLDRQRYQAQLAQVTECYPGTKTWARDDATWLSVPCFPIGESGPRADLFVVIPKRLPARILSWAFWSIDRGRQWIGPRHTNYPDGSACAFPVHENFWRDGDPLTAYLDRIAEWCFRQLYYAVHSVWPGTQEGPSPYYRRGVTRPGECCPRCRGLKPYESCCRLLDEAEKREDERQEFINRFGCDLSEQRPHDRIISFARGERERPPRVARVHPDLRTCWNWQN